MMTRGGVATSEPEASPVKASTPFSPGQGYIDLYRSLFCVLMGSLLIQPCRGRRTVFFFFRDKPAARPIILSVDSTTRLDRVLKHGIVKRVVVDTAITWSNCLGWLCGTTVYASFHRSRRLSFRKGSAKAIAAILTATITLLSRRRSANFATTRKKFCRISLKTLQQGARRVHQASVQVCLNEEKRSLSGRSRLFV